MAPSQPLRRRPIHQWLTGMHLARSMPMHHRSPGLHSHLDHLVPTILPTPRLCMGTVGHMFLPIYVGECHRDRKVELEGKVICKVFLVLHHRGSSQIRECLVGPKPTRSTISLQSAGRHSHRHHSFLTHLGNHLLCMVIVGDTILLLVEFHQETKLLFRC